MLTSHPLGKSLSLIDHEVTIENEELLLRNSRLRPRSGRNICVGKIKNPQHPIELVTTDARVYRAAGFVFT